MNKNYSRIVILCCSFAFTLLSGCSTTQSPQARVVDDVRQFLDPRLPDEEKSIMSDILRSGSTEVGEIVTFIDSKGHSHSNTLEGYNRIKAGGGLVVSQGSIYPYNQKK